MAGFLVGLLKFDYISRLKGNGARLAEVEKQASYEPGRVRDIWEARGGTIWSLFVDEGAVLRILPK